MKIQTIPLAQLNPAKYNPRQDLKPSDPEYRKLKKSMTEFGLVELMVWNSRSGNLVSGHQRLKILKEMGKTDCEVSVVDLDDKKEKALNIALNKISGSWDYPTLKDILEQLEADNFYTEIVGFDDNEIEELYKQDFRTEKIPERVEELKPRKMLRILVSIPLDQALEAKNIIEKIKNIQGAEVDYSSN